MKRLLSVILALAMAISMFPVAFATEETADDGVTVEYTFARYDANPTNRTYAVTGGRIMYDSVLGDKAEVRCSYEDYTILNLRDGNYAAFKIRVPVDGTYKMDLELSSKHSSSTTGSGIVDVHLLLAEVTLGLDLLTDRNKVLTEVGKTDEVSYTADNISLSAGEYYLVFKRNGYREGTAVDEKGNVKKDGMYTTWLKNMTLTSGNGTGRALIYADVTVEDKDAVLDAGNKETTEIVLNDVFMSDDKSATEDEKTDITYVSTDETVASVTGTTVTAKNVGKTTIRAMSGNYVLGEKELTVINSKLSGVKVEYSFAGNYGNDPRQTINYDSTNGRFKFENTNSERDGFGYNGGLAYFEIRDGNYVAFRIRVPVSGEYEVKFDVRDGDICNKLAVDMYILPGNTEDISNSLTTERLLIADICKTGATYSYSTNKELDAGEYIIAFKRTGFVDNATATEHVFRPKLLTLDGGDGSALIWADMSLDNTSLTTGNTATLTSVPYMSTGTVATDAEKANVTYTSTNESVATISGTTVTAIGEGAAKIQAKNGDYVLGEVDVTVTAPTAPTVSFYAESTDNTNTPIAITAIDVDNNAVEAANAATLNRGADVTVTAPEKDGYIFIGWFRGSKDNGRFVWADSEYSFKAMTHTMLTAVYEEAPEKAYYNFNGEFLGTSEPSESPTMLGYKFNGWNETVYNNLTRSVARYVKNKEKTFDVKLPAEVSVESVEKDEDNYYYDTKVTLTSNTDVTWLRNDKPVAYGREYTFYVWDDVEITTAPTVDTAPKVILDSSKSGAYMIEYDAGDKTVIEKGIIFGNDGDEVSIESCKEKMNSQRSEVHGQFTASSDYTNARGYLIYEDNGEYKVIYTD